jgi:glutaredoxin 3
VGDRLEDRSMMNTILTHPRCGWCDKAKELLADSNIEFTVQDVSTDPYAKELFKAYGFKTVPQIFLDGKHIGGHDDLVAHLGWGVPS